MTLIARHITSIMTVSGLLTTTMVYAALFPEAALRSTFGETLEGPLAAVLVRNWGVLVTLVGVGLIHGAFNPSTRPVALMAAIASKLAFIALVLSEGSRYLSFGAGPAVAIDSVMVVVFACYLASSVLGRRPRLVTA